MMLQNPTDVAAAVAELLRRGEVKVDERLAVAAPSAGEIEKVLAPLLAWCDEHRPVGGRGLVGIAAPAGAGKSHVAAWLAATARILGIDRLAFASMDGYHLPNSELDSRTGMDVDGKVVPLRQLKGTPPSFDAASLLRDLRQLKRNRESIWLPGYSRQLHDPVPHVTHVSPEVEWVFIEGNFLFLQEGDWREICDLLDRRVFIDAEEEVLQKRLEGRHARTGRDPAWFEAHYRRVDLPNIRLIRSTRPRADVVWTWSPEGRLQNQAQA